jgi:phage shock protein C
MTDPSGETAAEQLEALLTAGKISRDEYATLHAALEGVGRAPAGSAIVSDQAGLGPRPRLGKSRKNRMLLGVCGGIAEHLGCDPILIRILFILSLFITLGTTLLAYFVFYAFLPWSESAETDDPQPVGIPWGFAGLLAMVWLVFFILFKTLVPKYLMIFSELNAELPLLTRMLLSTTHFFYLTLLGLILQIVIYSALVGIYMILRNSASRNFYFCVVLALCVGMLIVYFFTLYLPLFDIPKLIK